MKLTKWEPKKYQLTGVSFMLSNKRGALFLDPGLGKTSITLASLKILINAGLVKGVLIIAPIRVVYSVWPSEITKWANFHKLTYTIVHDDNKQSIWDHDTDLYITNPESLPWLHKNLHQGLTNGEKPRFNCLVVDESTKFKSHDSKRFKLLCDMLPLFNRRYILTGTPCARSLMDLWAQMYLIDEGETLGNNFHKFKNKYFQADDWNKYKFELRDFAETTIQNLIAPKALEMSAGEYLDMPPLIHNYIDVGLNKKAMQLYKKLEKEYFLELDGLEVSADQAAQVTMKCQQLANGRVYEDIPKDLDEDQIKAFKKSRKTIDVHKFKVDALLDLIDELNGKPLLVGYHFKHDLEAIQKALGKIPYIGSGVSAKKGDQIAKDWNAGLIPVLAAHPDSMAYGLNLQQCGNDIALFSQLWNLENKIQFIARIWRQGVKGEYVRVHHLYAKGTIDDVILRRSEEKAKVQKDLRLALREYRLSIIGK